MTTGAVFRLLLVVVLTAAWWVDFAGFFIGDSPFVVAFEWPCCCCSHNNALAQAHACGGSNCKGRGISQGLQRSAAKVESPLVCTNGAQRSAEDWGDPLRARGAALLRKGFCCCCSARGSALRAGTGPLRWVAKDAHFRPQPGRILPPLKRTPIAYRACGLHNGPNTWFTSGWRIYFPSLCFNGRYQVCCLEWQKDRRSEER